MYPSYDDKDLEIMACRKKGVSCATCQHNGECWYSKLKGRLEGHNCPDWAEDENA